MHTYVRSTGGGTTHDPVCTTGNSGQCGIHVGRGEPKQEWAISIFSG